MNPGRAEHIVRLYAALRDSALPEFDDLDADTFVDALWIAFLRQSATKAVALPTQPVQPAPSTPTPEGAPDLPSPTEAHQDAPELFRLTPLPSLPSPPPSAPSANPPAALTTRAVAPRALSDGLGVSRALRPLRRDVASPMHVQLDEEATVVSIAETKAWHPILRPQQERWLSLVVLIDQGASMVLWREQVRELTHLLERQGAFRTIAIYGLCTDDNQPWLHSVIDIVGKQKRRFPPEVLIEPNGRRLVLIVSDCVADTWYTRASEDLLKVLAAQNQVVILQMLPERLWMRTALAQRPRVLLRAQGILPRTIDFVREPLGPTKVVNKGVAIPVAALHARSLAALARLLTGSVSSRLPGSVFSPEHRPKRLPSATPSESIEARVRSFEATTTPGARELARKLAVVPIILPVARLLARHCGLGLGTAEIAEIFLSGLLKPSPGPSATYGPLYTFEGLAGAYLARTVTIDERRSLLLDVGRAMSDLLSLPTVPKNFEALVELLQDTQGSSAFSVDFALLTARTLELMGGSAARAAADLLRGQVHPRQGEMSARSSGLDIPAGSSNNDLSPDRIGLTEFNDPYDTALLTSLLMEVIPEHSTNSTALLESFLQEDVPSSWPASFKQDTSLPKEQENLNDQIASITPTLPATVTSSDKTHSSLSHNDFPELDLPAVGPDDIRARFARAANRAVQQLGSLEEHYAALLTSVQSYGTALPSLYEVEVKSASTRLYYARTALESAEIRLRQLYSQVLQQTGNGMLQSFWWGTFGRARLQEVRQVLELLADAEVNLKDAEATLVHLKSLPLLVSEEVKALIVTVHQHREISQELAQRYVVGTTIEAERDIAYRVQQLIQALPPELREADEQALESLSPQWVAESRDAVRNSREILLASTNKLAIWRTQVDELDRQLAELGSLLILCRQHRGALSAELQPDAWRADLVQIESLVATLSQRRRGITVDNLAALGKALEDGLTVVSEFVQQLKTTRTSITYVKKALLTLSERVKALRTEIIQAQNGAFRITWSILPAQIDQLEQDLDTAKQWPILKDIEQTQSEFQYVQSLEERVTVIEHRLEEIVYRRANLHRQVGNPVLQRSVSWVQDIAKLQEQTRIFGRSNWARHLEVNELMRDAQRNVSSIELVPEQSTILPETQFDEAVNNVEHVIAQFQEFDRRVAEVQLALEKLHYEAKTAIEKVNYTLKLLERALTATPTERGLQSLRSEAKQLQRKLTLPIKESVADLALKANNVERRSVSQCKSVAQNLWAIYTSELSGVLNTMQRIRTLAPFRQDSELAVYQQAHSALKSRQITKRSISTLEQSVDDIIEHAGLLSEVRSLSNSVENAHETLQSAWSEVATVKRKVQDELSALQKSLAVWPPIRISLSQVENQIKQAEGIAKRARASETMSAFTTQTAQAKQAYQSCLQALRAELERAEEQRLRASYYEQRLQKWNNALSERIKRSDISTAMREQAEARLRTITSRLQALRDGYSARTRLLTPATAEEQLRTIWRDAHKDIIVGTRPHRITLRTKEFPDGSIQFLLIKR